jgi:cell surface protein SprA
MIAAGLTMWWPAAFSMPAGTSNTQYKTDTIPFSDSLHYPIHDRRGDYLSWPENNPFNLRSPRNVTDSVVYDAQEKKYYIIEKIGDKYYRIPTYYTFDEFMKLQARKQEASYFRTRADVNNLLNKKLVRPNQPVTDNLFNRIFGNGKVELNLQGNVDLSAGYQGQKTENPALPEISRKTGGFDFNMNADINATASIGNMLKLPISYNTLANFDFMNQLKLEYNGSSESIIKKIEAGNISFSTKSTLIPGAQSLFGIKTNMQFGKLYVSGVLASQRSQSQSMAVQNGATTNSFQFKASDYDENRHFLLAQYFRNNYNKAMRNMPAINSAVQLLRVEVWVTNRTGATTNAREVVGLSDIGEASPSNSNIHSLAAVPYPYNDANDEYRNIVNNSNGRQSSTVVNVLTGMGLQQSRDFEKVYARKLDSTSYKFYPKLGFISLNQQLQSNDVLAVAYQYSYNGRIYQVGEFSQDVPPDTTSGNYSGTQKVLLVKLLKATAPHTDLPIWDLMMKNVYSLRMSGGSYISNIQQDGFRLNVLYDEPGKGSKRYLPEGDKTGIPLISVLNLDRLNSNNDPSPDGVFDYVEGYTINANNGLVIFPLLEPFGHDLDSLAFTNSATIAKNYVYSQLYDTIKAVAQTFSNLNRYVISGTAKGQAGSDISLNAFNVPQGSVKVTAGGQTLTENVDYVVDYTQGTVRIINQAIINSGVAVNVQFENNALSGVQQKGLMGLRLDYVAKQTPTESLNIGATIERLNERPFFTKVSYNEDPIRNTMYGMDVNYFTQSRQLTRWLNRLPFYNTKEVSTITAYAESAVLKPGHAKQIGKGSNGTIYIDDFEGSAGNIDMRYPITNWALASTPQGNGLFPEATLTDSREYGYNRANLAWYNIETTLQSKSSVDNPVRSYENFGDPRIASIIEQQLFPQRSSQYGTSQLVTFDLAYYPTERGPYNYDARAGSVNANGKLLNPQKRWGGIMRAIDQSDFETSNIQYVEFWMQDPFIMTPSAAGGQLYIDLGSVSEDILKDQKRLYENGLPTASAAASTDTSVWGKMPLSAVQVTNAFSNDAADRPYQDVGLDGLNDDSERVQFKSYVSDLATQFGTGSAAYQAATTDPSSDNYVYFRDGAYDDAKTGILGRYKHINGTQGNSPVAGSSDKYVSAFTLYPDEEDVDKDNSMNELEAYYEYKVDLTPASLVTGTNFITDKRTFTPSGGVTQTWYQFRIPIKKYAQAVGGIADFKSIRFMRVYLTGFSDSVVCRFASLDLVRNSWRSFDYVLDTTGEYTALPTTSATTFNVTAVNVEENSSRTPVPYVLPPGIQRQESLSNNNATILQNEQAMSLQVCNLAPKDGRGVYKNISLDLRRYGKLNMFIHAEGAGSDNAIDDGQLYAVMRLGSDFINNYYEIKIPLQKTHWGATADTDVWPAANELQLTLQDLVQLKVNRNNTTSSNVYYQQKEPGGRILAIFGNPSLGQIEAFFLGVQNAGGNNACAELWFDELRLSDIDEKGGWAAVGKVDVKLADLGTLNLAGSYKSAGFGSIDQHINERSLNNNLQMDAATNLELGKLLPGKTGISIPVYAGISKTLSTPEYDPFDTDIKLKEKLKGATAAQRDSILQQAQNMTQMRTLNFTGVRKNNIRGKKLKPWSIENLSLNYSVTITDHRDSVTEKDQMKYYKASLDYNYSNTPIFMTPFKKMIKTKSAWLAFLKDFNLNLLPTTLAFNASVNRQLEVYQSRSIGGLKNYLPESYNRYFRINRTYNYRWDLTRSLAIDFSATNNSVVDEDSGSITKTARENMWKRFLKGGRNTLYQHQLGASYTFPTSKLPFLNWTQVHADYRATYGWTAASLLAKSLGNTLQNTQTKSITAQLNFTDLYNKSALLRSLQEGGNNMAPAPPPVPPQNTKDTTASKKKERVRRALPPLAKGLLNLLLSVKQVNLQYAENANSTIYGYMDSTQLLGMNLQSMQPGWRYVLGGQPNTAFIDKMIQKGLLSGDSAFNSPNLQNLNQQLTLTAQLQPIRDLTIDISLTKSFGKDFTELIKDTLGNGVFSHLNQSTMGSFSISYISVKTLFEKSSGTTNSATFEKFENNRITISQRLGSKNPYSGTQQSDGYYKGYGKYSQDVLIPAFLAAYTGKDPNSISLIKASSSGMRSNPFAGYLPKPNWRLTYNGLTRIPGMEKIFRSFTIGHAYTGSLSVGTFSSSLYYKDPLGVNYPGFIDTATGNFYPYSAVPTITISEQFAPLLSMDMQMVNNMQANFDYSKSRQLSLSLTDYQMTESRTTQFTLGLGWRKQNVQLPFNIQITKTSTPRSGGGGGTGGANGGGGNAKKGNDITMHLDMSIADNETINHYLDQENAIVTGGQRIVRLSPSVDVVVSNRVNVKLYYNRSRSVPKISTSVPITTVSAGLQVRIVLSK